MLLGRKNDGFRFYKHENLSDGEIFLFLRGTLGADAIRGYVPSYYFDICDLNSGKVYGRCDLRVGDNDKLYYAGHIGYAVYKPFRGRRYAFKACRLLFALARLHNMKRLIITCNPDNFASMRTCELLDARYVETVSVPEDHELYLKGETLKRVYEIAL